MDVLGRKLYMLSRTLADVVDLDTYNANAITAPWKTLLGGSQGPGVAWHEASRRLILWLGGQTLYRIDPVTNLVEQATMAGAPMPSAPQDGTYGSFALQGDTLYFLKSIYANVLIGTLPTTWVPWGSAPPPPPPLAVPTLTAAPISVTGGQPAVLTLSLPGLDYHNLFINGTRPACVVGATTMVCSLTVTPLLTTVYQATGTNAAGTPYALPNVTVTVGVIPPPPVPQVTLVAVPDQLLAGQSSVLTLALPGLDYHNLFINGVRPACVVSGTTATCTMTVTPATTTTYQVTATNAAGTPYTMPSVVVTVTTVVGAASGVIQVPAGQPIPPRRWVERQMPPVGLAFMAGQGGKHGRAFYHPGLKGLVFAGGDWRSSMSAKLQLDGNGEGSEIWTLNALANTWNLLRPLCVPGAVQPRRPDSVTWAYDSRRDQGVMAPGYFFEKSSNCGAIEGVGGYTFSFATRQFSGPTLPLPPGGWGGDIGASFGLYDPVADELIRVRNGGPTLERLNLATLTWRTQRLWLSTTWNPNPNRAQPVLDVQGRALYWVDAYGTPPSLIRVRLTDGAVTAVPLPPQYVPMRDVSAEIYLAFDPRNRVVLLPNNVDMGITSLKGLGLYFVDAGRWEWESVPTPAWGSVWGFDENTGALVGIGKRTNPTAYYLYKVN